MASSCGRTCNSLSNLYPLSVRLSNSSVISLRWRKPRWIPKTQSKVFYVRKPTETNEDEIKMMKERYSIYRTQMKAIRSYFTKIVTNEKEAMKEYKYSVEFEQEREKIRIAMEVNKEWNIDSAKLREARELAEARENARVKAIIDAKHKAREDRHIAQLQSKIDENIKSSDKFITPENMDEEIEKVLDSRVDFNFPIDRKGRIDERRKKIKKDTSSEPES